MTVLDFLSTCRSTETQITIFDNDKELITFKASGYKCLDDELEQRHILQWVINGPTVKITLIPETTGV